MRKDEGFFNMEINEDDLKNNEQAKKLTKEEKEKKEKE